MARHVNNLYTSGKKITLTAYYTTNTNKALNQSIQNKTNFLYSLIDNRMDLNNFYAKYNLELPINKHQLTLNTGRKYNYFSANSFGKYNLNNPSHTLFLQPQYNDSLLFKYVENTLAFYVEAKKSLGKSNITAGARLENLNYQSQVVQKSIQIKNTYTNFFPNLNFNYQFNKIIQLNASYTQKIAMPPYNGNLTLAKMVILGCITPLRAIPSFNPVFPTILLLNLVQWSGCSWDLIIHTPKILP